MEPRPYIAWSLLDDFMTSAFVKLGVPYEDAKICSDVLMESDREGLKATVAIVSNRFMSTGS
jgi:LDH2 family malate/lactate/ureidoglycolate dehydrogenase